ncbi:hypothetical protein CGRA01v4_03896 [Colletotrichum graminicola]|nr:hypothetical protein CGRA01v4_03896 [Colletotrichum graminicola]
MVNLPSGYAPPAHCTSLDTEDLDREAAVVVARAGQRRGQGLKAMSQAKSLEPITQPALIPETWALSLPSQLSLTVRPPQGSGSGTPCFPLFGRRTKPRNAGTGSKQRSNPSLMRPPFILMCTGDPEKAVVVPVAIGENADAVDQWKAIQNTSRKSGSSARMNLVRKHSGEYSSPSTLRLACRCFRKEASEDQSYITEPIESDERFQTRCWHDTSSDRVEHSGFCGDPYRFECIDLNCYVQDQRDRLEEISKLELMPTWPMFLAEPSLAWGNGILLEKWLHHSKTIALWQDRKAIHSVAQIEFTGFRLSEWPYGRQNVVPRPSVVGGIVTFCGIIFVARVIHGDWGVAYTAGAFFVALAGVFSTWAAGQSSNPDRRVVIVDRYIHHSRSCVMGQEGTVFFHSRVRFRVWPVDDAVIII